MSLSKKVFVAITLASLTGCVVSTPAEAISASYRAKLERSGCTEMSVANGTCNENRSREWNRRHQKSNANMSKREIKDFLVDFVMGVQERDAAYQMRKNGWTRVQGSRWSKGQHEVTLFSKDGRINEYYIN